MDGGAAPATSRPPVWRDVRVLRWLFQLAILTIVVAIVAVLYSNVTRNSQRLNIPTDFGGQSGHQQSMS